MSKARPAVRPAVTDVYELISDRPLGSGNYGQVSLFTIIVFVTALMSTIQVFLMRNRNTGVEVAAKCLQKHTSWTPEKFRQRVAEEVSCLFASPASPLAACAQHHAFFPPLWLNLCVKVEDAGHISNLPRMICMLVPSCLPALTDTRCER